MKNLFILIAFVLLISSCAKIPTCYEYLHYAKKGEVTKCENVIFDHKLDANEMEHFVNLNKNLLIMDSERNWLQYYDEGECQNN